MRIAPFAALRPPPALAEKVASVPYDVVNTKQAAALAKDKPESFLHVVRPEIDLPADTGAYDDAVYAQGKKALDDFVKQGFLEQDADRAVYLYRQIREGHAQTGIVCCCHVDDYEKQVIKRHEFTRKQKEDDRTRHVQTTEANTGPVFLAFRSSSDVDALIDTGIAASPLYDFVAEDGVQHTAWKVKDPAAYVTAFEAIDCAYVADGHHRTASAARAGTERKAANPKHDGSEEYNWFLTVMFPSRSLVILPYHRVLLTLGDKAAADIQAALAKVGKIEATTNPGPTDPGVFDVYFGKRGGWSRVTIDPASIDAADPVASLDVGLVQDRVLAPIFGIEDVRSDDRIDFVGGVHGTGELERRVDAGEAAMAIAMGATTIDQLMGVADAGQVMPPKSTWFEPKLRSGLFVHKIV